MSTSTLSSKGQVVIPKAVRDRLNLHAGDVLDFLVQESGDVVLRPAAEDVGRLKGMLYRPGRKAVSLNVMKEAIRRRGGAGS